jgi:hypothetical protein
MKGSKTMIKKQCQEYLGNRGIYQDIKRCAKYKNMWFIVFKEYPQDVEVSFNSYCYECYTDIPVNNMKWNKAFYETINQKIQKEKEEYNNRVKGQ